MEAAKWAVQAEAASGQYRCGNQRISQPRRCCAGCGQLNVSHYGSLRVIPLCTGPFTFGWRETPSRFLMPLRAYLNISIAVARGNGAQQLCAGIPWNPGSSLIGVGEVRRPLRATRH